jgi:2'-5' RNA ligase
MMGRRPRESDARLRLFVAVYPPPRVVEALLREAHALGLRSARPAQPDQVHLTLQFIGDTAVRDLEHVGESVLRAAAGLAAFPLAPLRLVALPRRGPNRLIAAETDAPPTLLELKRRLVSRHALRPRGEAAETFLPHMTLARLSPPRALDFPDRTLAAESFVVSEVKLMRSALRPSGAVHHEVLSAPLDPAPAARA